MKIYNQINPLCYSTYFSGSSSIFWADDYYSNWVSSSCRL